MKAVRISRSVIEGILDYARASHPREIILLLRGMIKKDEAIISEVELPPLAIRGRGFSAFPWHMLPIDYSIVGTTHSHPSGSLQPSVTDLNQFYGKIMVIAAFPYNTERDIAAYDGKGREIEYKAVDPGEERDQADEDW